MQLWNEIGENWKNNVQESFDRTHSQSNSTTCTQYSYLLVSTSTRVIAVIGGHSQRKGKVSKELLRCRSQPGSQPLRRRWRSIPWRRPMLSVRALALYLVQVRSLPFASFARPSASDCGISRAQVRSPRTSRLLFKKRLATFSPEQLHRLVCLHRRPFLSPHRRFENLMPQLLASEICRCQQDSACLAKGRSWRRCRAWCKHGDP